MAHALRLMEGRTSCATTTHIEEVAKTIRKVCRVCNTACDANIAQRGAADIFPGRE